MTDGQPIQDRDQTSQTDPDADLHALTNFPSPGPSDAELTKWDALGERVRAAFQSPEVLQLPELTGFREPFQVMQVLGRGGNGSVFLARDTLLDRLVAIKFLHMDGQLETGAVARFLQEAKFLAQIRHPHVVEIYHVDQTSWGPYLVLSYCAGGSLAQWMQTQTEPLSPMLCARIVRMIAYGVQAAHSHRIVHRDLTPKNVLLVPLAESSSSSPPSDFPFQIKVSDFGLGKSLLDAPLAIRTVSGAIAGTIPYMAPEQTKSSGGEVHPTIDVYALGAILYELLTRRCPFVGADPFETVQLIRHREYPRLRSLRSDVSSMLEIICDRCLEKSPLDRFQTAQELIDELTRFLNGEEILSKPPSLLKQATRRTIRGPLRGAWMFPAVLSGVLLLVMFWPRTMPSDSAGETHTPTVSPIVSSRRDASPRSPFLRGDGRDWFEYPDKCAGADSRGNLIFAVGTKRGGRVQFSVSRLTPSGSLDATFQGGTINDQLILGSQEAIPTGVQIQPDDKILVTGWVQVDNQTELAVVRYTPTGTRDTTWGTNGLVMAEFGTHALHGMGIALQADGKVVVVGSSANSTRGLVLRYRQDGSLDPTFDGDGQLENPVGVCTGFYSVAIDLAGRIVIGGNINSSSRNRMLLLRLHPDGSVDEGFGTRGKLVCSAGEATTLVAIKLNADKILAYGSIRQSPQTDFENFLVAQYLENGLPDPEFSKTGYFSFFKSKRPDVCYSVQVQSDGKLLCGGQADNQAGMGFLACRLSPAGELDRTFGMEGHIRTASSDKSDQGGFSLVPLADGRFYFIGGTHSGSQADVVIARYTADGQIDPTYGQGGFVRIDGAIR